MKLLCNSLSVMCALALGAPTSAQFTVLHSFAGGASDGSSPYGSLIQSSSILYGMTENGGSYGSGTLFSLVVPEPSSLALALLAGGLLRWRLRTNRE